MGNQDIHLLCTGDLHLGRHPGGIPEEYDSREFSPTVIWEKIVDKALKQKVDALLISGDIIDRNNRYFEAFGPLEAGIKRLAENKIDVFAVAGNHDYDILPRLAKNNHTDNFHLLGEGGKWEFKSIKKDGESILNIAGWSYPAAQVRKSPLSELQPVKTDIPTVGLLHSEVNNPGSNYAPVTVDRLEESDFKGWILGHIHKEFLISDISSFILNPGSPQPLHPAEPGFHNIYEVVIKSSGSFEIKKYLLASLLYMNLEVDISGREQITELPVEISENIEQKLESAGEMIHIPELIITRIKLTGKTPLNRKIETDKQKLQELELSIFGSRIIIDRIENKTDPALNLEEIANGSSQAALLANYLLQLKSRKGQDLPEGLLKRVEEKLFSVYHAPAYQPLRKYNHIQPPTRDKVFSILEKQAGILLASLLDQKEELM